MNATHASSTVFHHSSVALVAMYAALAVQLAVWSSLAAHVNLGAAFTQAHQGTAATIVVGGAIWLVQFTLAVAAVTIRHHRHSR
jgi:hypothetical protein